MKTIHIVGHQDTFEAIEAFTYRGLHYLIFQNELRKPDDILIGKLAFVEDGFHLLRIEDRNWEALEEELEKLFTENNNKKLKPIQITFEEIHFEGYNVFGKKSEYGDYFHRSKVETKIKRKISPKKVLYFLLFISIFCLLGLSVGYVVHQLQGKEQTAKVEKFPTLVKENTNLMKAINDAKLLNDYTMIYNRREKWMEDTTADVTDAKLMVVNHVTKEGTEETKKSWLPGVGYIYQWNQIKNSTTSQTYTYHTYDGTWNIVEETLEGDTTFYRNFTFTNLEKMTVLEKRNDNENTCYRISFTNEMAESLGLDPNNLKSNELELCINTSSVVSLAYEENETMGGRVQIMFQTESKNIDWNAISFLAREEKIESGTYLTEEEKNELLNYLNDSSNIGFVTNQNYKTGKEINVVSLQHSLLSGIVDHTYTDEEFAERSLLESNPLPDRLINRIKETDFTAFLKQKTGLEFTFQDFSNLSPIAGNYEFIDPTDTPSPIGAVLGYQLDQIYYLKINPVTLVTMKKTTDDWQFMSCLNLDINIKF